MKLFFILILLVGPAWAQVCTVDEAPEWRSLRLGMTRKEFTSRFPGLNAINMFNRQQLERVRGYSGLEQLAFRINNQSLRLDQIEARYAGLSGSLDRLAKRVSRELGLPFDAWKMDADHAEMKCLKFSVSIDSSNNSFTLTDLVSQKYWDSMRDRDKKRPSN